MCVYVSQLLVEMKETESLVVSRPGIACGLPIDLGQRCASVRASQSHLLALSCFRFIYQLFFASSNGDTFLLLRSQLREKGIYCTWYYTTTDWSPSWGFLGFSSHLHYLLHTIESFFNPCANSWRSDHLIIGAYCLMLSFIFYCEKIFW